MSRRNLCAFPTFSGVPMVFRVDARGHVFVASYRQPFNAHDWGLFDLTVLLGSQPAAPASAIIGAYTGFAIYSFFYYFGPNGEIFEGQFSGSSRWSYSGFSVNKMNDLDSTLPAAAPGTSAAVVIGTHPSTTPVPDRILYYFDKTFHLIEVTSQGENMSVKHVDVSQLLANTSVGSSTAALAATLANVGTPLIRVYLLGNAGHVLELGRPLSSTTWDCNNDLTTGLGMTPAGANSQVAVTSGLAAGVAVIDVFYFDNAGRFTSIEYRSDQKKWSSLVSDSSSPALDTASPLSAVSLSTAGFRAYVLSTSGALQEALVIGTPTPHLAFGTVSGLPSNLPFDNLSAYLGTNDDGTTTFPAVALAHASELTPTVGVVSYNQPYLPLAWSWIDVTELSSPGPSWMSVCWPALKTRTLPQICLPGSHDAAMWTISKGYRFGDACNSQTQSADITGQLQLGARYFDIRPGVWSKLDGGPHAAHFSFPGGVAFGAFGAPIGDVLNGVKSFLTDANTGKSEIVFLQFTHACNLDQSDNKYTESNWTQLIAQVKAVLGTYLYCSATNSSLINVSLETIIASNGRVVTLYGLPEDFASLADASKGVFTCVNPDSLDNLESRSASLILYDSFADTEDIDKMKADQLKKTIDFAGKNVRSKVLDLLSFTWTRKPSPWSQCMDVMAPATNFQLPGAFRGWIDSQQLNSQVYPNIIVIDYLTDTRLLSTCIRLNQIIPQSTATVK
jgi:hypothetical protein